MTMLDSQSLQPTPHRTQMVEIALALGFAFLFFLSPVSSGNRFSISLFVGVVFGALFYGYRWLAARSVEPPVLAARSSENRVRPAELAAIVATLALFAPTWIGLFPWYTESVWRNGHGLFLPLLIWALVRIKLRLLSEAEPEPSAAGLALLLPGLMLALLDAGIASLHLAVAAMPLVVAGLVVIFRGFRWARALAVPTLLLLFLAPIPSGISHALGMDVATAAGAEATLRALGYSVLREGVILRLEADFGYEISLRCAGFSIFYAAVALSIALGSVVGSWRRALTLCVVAFPLTCVANGVRVGALIVLCEWLGKEPSQTLLHGVSGIAAFLGVLFVIMLLGGRTARHRLVLA